jgi:hypothetical protein
MRHTNESGLARLPDADALASFSRKTLRDQVRTMPDGPRKAAIERAIAYAERWPNSYLAKHITTIYGVEL